MSNDDARPRPPAADPADLPPAPPVDAASAPVADYDPPGPAAGLPARHGQLAVLSGPAGSGKTTLANEVLRRMGPDRVRRAVTATTRPPRAGEVDGVDYHFLDRATFAAGIAENRFVEFTEFNGHFYGCPRIALEASIERGGLTLLVIEVDGAESIRFFFPRASFIFVVPPTPEELRRRLSGRGTESAAAVHQRLGIARRELARLAEYDYLVVNADLGRAVADLEAVLRVISHSRIFGGEAEAWERGAFADWGRTAL